jgi:hypothetical protein
MSADTNDDETQEENSLALDDSIDSQPEQTKNLNTNLDFHFVAQFYNHCTELTYGFGIIIDNFTIQSQCYFMI